MPPDGVRYWKREGEGSMSECGVCKPGYRLKESGRCSKGQELRAKVEAALADLREQRPGSEQAYKNAWNAYAEHVGMQIPRHYRA